MQLRTWTSRDVRRGTKVLVRCDFNVLVRDAGKVAPTGRIAMALPELRRLRKQGAAVIIVTHVGRPQGVNTAFSVRPIARTVASELGCEVMVADDVAGSSSMALAHDLGPGELLMLENVRFDNREEKDAAVFARQLAGLADVYVNNAFGVCHRAHASVHAITRYIPSFAGELLVREVRELTRPFSSPFVLAIGGIKLETKLPLLAKLGPQADVILIGSGFADELAMPSRLFAKALAPSMHKICMPMDLRRDADHHAFDLGPKTTAAYIRALQGAKTVVWNGAFGITERAAGRKSTLAIVRAMTELRGARIITGGGDTERFLQMQNLSAAFDWVSTGGGAMLALLAGERMPGLLPLVQK